MKTYRSLLLLSALLGVAGLPATAANYILETKAGIDPGPIASRYGLAVLRTLDSQTCTVFLVSGPDPALAPTLGRDIASDSRVRQFESDAGISAPNWPAKVATPADPSALAAAIANRTPVSFYGATVRSAYVQQAPLSLIGAPSVLQSYASGTGIVAVIDTGVDPNHPALKSVLVPGYDFTRDQAGYASELADLTQSTVAILDQSTVAILDSKRYPMLLNQSTVAILDQSTVAILDGSKLPNDFGHGTMVAGLVHLVAPTARIMPLKAFRADGSANLSDIVRAIYYAVDNGATVINMSFSSRTQSASLTEAMLYAWNHNVICVASGGNDGKDVTVYPAGDRGVIGVGSTNLQDQRSPFSNYDAPSVRIAAPGEALITTYPGNNYAGVWGTSFSTALTSGAVAVFQQVNTRMKPSKVQDVLDHGKKLDNDVADARLDILASVLYCLTY